MIEKDFITYLIENSFSTLVALICLVKIDRTLISMNNNIATLNHLLTFNIKNDKL